MGTFLLIWPLLAVSAWAQAQAPAHGLPWEGQPEPPWRASEAGAPPTPMPPEPPGQPSSARLRVYMTSHGVLRILDDRGLVRLRLGLPGRPLRMWRDGGTPMSLSDFPCTFPLETPLSRGASGMAVGVDFRPLLKGLLWILDDGERLLTVLHPATGQAVYLQLPGGRDLSLFMYADRLELREPPPVPGTRRESACWAVPWMGLLPQFLRLATALPAPPPGTALKPFSAED